MMHAEFTAIADIVLLASSISQFLVWVWMEAENNPKKKIVLEGVKEAVHLWTNHGWFGMRCCILGCKSHCSLGLSTGSREKYLQSRSKLQA